MQKEIIIAGFGGQGVLFGGQVIAYAAMDATTLDRTIVMITVTEGTDDYVY